MDKVTFIGYIQFKARSITIKAKEQSVFVTSCFHPQTSYVRTPKHPTPHPPENPLVVLLGHQLQGLQTPPELFGSTSDPDAIIVTDAPNP
jgi:hypothetical protein